MTLPTTTRQWVLTNKPTDLVSLSGPNPTFTQSTTPIPSLKPNQVLLKTLYLSNDPAQRSWISKDVNPDRMYLPPVEINEVLRARAITEVLESTAEGLKKGMLVSANAGWKDYSVVDAKECSPVADNLGVKPTQFLGAFGLTGLTALFGIRDVVKAGPGDTVVVSGAAGAAGSMVVQIAKNMLGCKRVVGIAGSDDKCRWVESLGADICVNYKKPDFKKELIKATESYVEVYFDNVGGVILDLMLTRMARHGRIAACGAVSDYNTSQPTGLRNWGEVIVMRIEIRGFIILDFAAKFAEGTEELIAAYQKGKIRVGDENETIVETSFEDVPKTWVSLFEGRNTGKLVTKLKYGESSSL